MNAQGITGVPVGVKVVAYRPSKAGEYFLSITDNEVVRARNTNYSSMSRVIVEPDNVYGVVDLNAVPVPEGYERDGKSAEEWFRVPIVDRELWIDPCPPPSMITGKWDWDGDVGPLDCGNDNRRIIVRKTTPPPPPPPPPPPAPKRRFLVIEIDITHVNKDAEYLSDVSAIISLPGGEALTHHWLNRHRIEDRSATPQSFESIQVQDSPSIKSSE